MLWKLERTNLGGDDCHLNEEPVMRNSLVLSGSFRLVETENKAGNSKRRGGVVQAG